MSNSELADVSLEQEPPSKQNNDEIPLDLETPPTSELNDVDNTNKSNDIDNTNKLDDKLPPPKLPPKDNETPPPMPARPSNSKILSQIDLTINQLIEMFPETDLKFIKMALIASEGRLEPASNALLFLSDPNSGIEIPIPNPDLNTNIIDPSTQLESDEALARSLARSYEKGNNSKSHYNHKHISPSMKKHHSFNNNLEDKDFDDEDDIYDTFTKNVTEAKQIVGGWFDNISKKIQGSSDQPQQQQSFEYSNYSSQKQIGNQNLYQKQQQSIQKGYGLNENNTSNDDDVPKLPPRRSDNTLYPAVNHSDTSVNLQTQIKLSDNSNELPPNPVEKDDSYISNSIQKSSNKKSNLNTENEKLNEQQLKDTNSKSDKKWSPLKDAEPEPSNDAFLVGDSEDDDNDNK